MMHLTRRLLAALALAGLGATATAATLNLTVVDKQGLPVPDTVVLLRYLIAPAHPPPTATVATIAQKGMKFLPFISVVAPGTSVRFTNEDDFDHHVRANGPPTTSGASTDFEARVGAATGRSHEVRLATPGRYALGCHLHSSMRGYVLVTETPWFGKTDASGRLKLDALPEGPVDVQLWHPEQFLDQAPQRVVLDAAGVELRGQLNFVPRKRRAAGG